MQDARDQGWIVHRHLNLGADTSQCCRQALRAGGSFQLDRSHFRRDHSGFSDKVIACDRRLLAECSNERQGLNKMPDDNSTMRRHRVTEIVAAYVGRNRIAPEQLASLISTVHQALGDLGNPAIDALGERTPAVPIRRSVHRDHVVCLECGWKGQVLRRHLSAAHGLSVDEYRARWNLRADHAVTAPAYSERRSMMAKEFGLGRGRPASAKKTGVPETETATAPKPSSKLRGRPRSKPTMAAPA